MKVIEEGGSWKKVIKCKGCSSVLEIESEDVGHKLSEAEIDSQQYEDDIEGTYFVTCPKCGQDLTIRKQDLPTPTKKLAREKI